MSLLRPLPIFLTQGQVGDILRITERTVQKWRDRGFGPPYRRLGHGPHHKPIYDLHALQTWLKQYSHCGEEGSA